MKKLLFLIFILSINTIAFSQEDKTKSSIFTLGENYSWYISTSFSATIFDIYYGAMLNFETGIYLNKNLSVGAFYSTGLGVSPDGYSSEDGYNNYLDLGGLKFSYTLKPQDRFHPSIFLKSGFGNYALETISSAEFVNISVFTFSPGISIDYRVNNYFKLGLHTSYRNVSPINLSTLGETKLSGTEIGFTFKIGSF